MVSPGRVLSPSTSLSPGEMDAIPQELQELVHELQQAVQGEVRFDGYSRMLYSTDASLYQIQPVGVVIPRVEEDIQATVEITARHGVPVLPRGGGSSLAGQTVNAAVVIDTSKYLDRILALDPEARRVTVQVGLSLARLNQTLAPLGLMVGPDPASADRATVGGCLGNNATGSHSILYGMMADHVLETWVVLADGSRAHFHPIPPEELPAWGRGDSLEARLYRELPALLQEIRDAVLERWPRHWRRASGYNLDRLLAPLLGPEERGRLSSVGRFRPPAADLRRLDRFNLAQLVTGAEGTLAVVTQATLALVERPSRTGLAVVHFSRLLDSCAAVTDVLETEPSAAELLDRKLMDLARSRPEWARRLHFVEGDPEAVLLVEYYGRQEEELRARLDRLERHLRGRGWRGPVVKILDPARQAQVWAVRKAGLNLLMGMRGDFKPVPGIEDVAVPPEKLAEYLGQILEHCRPMAAVPDVAVYAHASAGCLHVRPLLNMKSQAGVDALAELGHFACDLAVRYNGAMSGEHGDGLARSGLNPRLFGPSLYAALQRVKRLFDPQNRLNPGKIVDAPPPTRFLRFGPDYHTQEPVTVFDWQADGGYAAAIEMCNGAGVCRKLGEGTMCPSFMATRDEEDSTRGRANALRNALAGRIPPEELFSPRMYRVLDLCLGCKACRSECPSAVDMARIKAEYLVHYYRRHGLPLFNRLMGLLPALGQGLFRLQEALPGLPLVAGVNGLLGSALAQALAPRLGIHPARPLPRYASRRLSRWFAARGVPPKGPRGPVILFHDTWAEYHVPWVGQAAVQVLEAAGYRVFLAWGRSCCGRPLLTGGQADRARAWVDHNVALLAPYAAQGIPVIGLEPSCILTLRDEYPDLASDRTRARLLAGWVQTFEEFVVQEAARGGFRGIWQEGGVEALLHGHCHHRALVGDGPSVAALEMAGYRVAVIPSGCCGMAGDFGYGVEHYAISRRIGEDRLFPAVRAAEPDTVVVASGFSCREQIHHFTGREAIHLAQALARRLGRARRREEGGR